MTRYDWQENVVKQELTKTYDSQETIDKFAEYIVEHDLPINQWLDVDTCDKEDCGRIDHEFIDTEGMVNGGIGVICMSCYIDM